MEKQVIKFTDVCVRENTDAMHVLAHEDVYGDLICWS